MCVVTAGGLRSEDEEGWFSGGILKADFFGRLLKVFFFPAVRNDVRPLIDSSMDDNVDVKRSHMLTSQSAKS